MQNAYSPGHREQIVPVHTLVLPDLVVRADAARVDHDAPVGVRLGVQQVVAFRAEVEGSLCAERRGCPSSRGQVKSCVYVSVSTLACAQHRDVPFGLRYGV